MIEVLAAFIGNIECVDTVTPQNERQLSVNTASTEHQQSVNRASTQCEQSVNRVSTLLGVASCIIQGLWYGIDPYSTYWQPFCANEIVTTLQQLSGNERQQSVNDFVFCILYNPRAVLQHLFIIELLAVCIGTIVCVNTATPQNERQKSINRASTPRQQSVNRVSMIVGVASCIIQGLCYGIYA